MTPPLPEQRAGGAPLGLTLPDVLAERLAVADTPYRAWAAVALLTGTTPRHKAEGLRLAIELADWMPAAEELQHADLVGYALLDRAGFVALDRQEALRAAIPRPHLEAGRRARLYGSSTYVYLLARGVGARLPWATDLVRYVDEELKQVTEHAAPDLVELSLLVAARLELATVASPADEMFRRVRGRVAGADDSREGAIALRWLLEVYGSHWPASTEAEELRGAIRAYAERAASAAPPAADGRLVLAAMQLEAGTRHDPELRLTTRADQASAVAAHLGHRRWSEGAAYLFVIAVVAGAPALAAVKAGWFQPVVGWAAALGWGVPAAVWTTLLVAGRPRDITALGTGLTAGVFYTAAALYAGWAHKVSWMPILAGEEALIGVVLTTIFSSLVAGFKVRKG